jgi:hypothetical protein
MREPGQFIAALALVPVPLAGPAGAGGHVAIPGSGPPCARRR